MPWSVTEISTMSSSAARAATSTDEPLGGVGHRVGDQVADRDGDLLAVAEHLQALLAGRRPRRCSAPGRRWCWCRRRWRPRRRRRPGPAASSGSSPWSRDSSMICCTSRTSRSLSVQHPAGEPLDGLGVVGGVLHGLGQQPDRADRRLELVADVGDEVAADRLDPALAGAVLDQGQHQPAAERRDPGGHVPRRGRPAYARSPARSRGSGRRGVPAGPARPARRRPSRCCGPGRGRTPARRP